MKAKSLSLLISVSAVIGIILFQNFSENHLGIILPDFPLRNIDTRPVIRNSAGIYETQTPHLPAHEMSLDGRIALRKRGDSRGVPFFILKPERVHSHLGHPQNDKVGANLMDSEANFYFNPLQTSIRSQIPLPNNYKPGRTFLCEKTEKKLSPYICNTIDDCYDFTLITRYNDETSPVPKAVLVSMNVTLQVANPKTLLASVRSFKPAVETIKMGPVFEYPKFAEPVIVGDNRLLLFRLGSGDNVKLSDGTAAGTNIDIVYSSYRVFDDSNHRTEQCDVTRWTPQNTHPISHAHYDKVSRMRSRYKFARYPLRDNLGNLILNGQDLGGSYQWMDRDAANLFFTSGGKDSFYNVSKGNLLTPYLEPSSPSYSTPTSDPLDINLYEEVGDNTALIYMAGFWTYGKMILLDGNLNNADYNLRIADRKVDGQVIPVERKWQLYSNTPSGQEFEPIGGVRELGGDFDATMYHPHLSTNSSFLGSIENRFHYLNNMKPVTPRDLVWHFGSTRFSEEIVLDEYVSPYVLINAEMTGASSAVPTFKRAMNYYDGILNSKTVAPIAFTPNSTPQAGQLFFQNAVSQPVNFLAPPKLGEPIGSLRLEPIAKGGIHGKGLWLNGNAGLKFTIPAQTGMTYSLVDAPLYISVFIDPRETDSSNKERPLVSLANGEKIVLAKTPSNINPVFVYDTVILRDQFGGKISEMKLDAASLRNQKWVNLGIRMNRLHRPTFFIDGFLFKTFEPSIGVTDAKLKSFFKIMDGGNTGLQPAIILGSPNTTESSVRGWFDDFKVIARAPSVEEICNYARGTLADVDGVTEQAWIDKVNIYPAESQTLFTEKSLFTGNKFLCITRYGSGLHKKFHADPLFSHFKNLPPGAVSIREKVLLKRKDLIYGKPRPDFLANKFCLSCHVNESPNSYAEMDTRALLRNAAVKLEDDPRRQPIQAPRIFRGVVPANYFGVGKPAATLYLDESKIDQWLEVP